jgi:hypothetical protein
MSRISSGPLASTDFGFLLSTADIALGLEVAVIEPATGAANDHCRPAACTSTS